MKRKGISLLFCLMAFVAARAEEAVGQDNAPQQTETKKETKAPWRSRLTLGGYGEAVMTRNFFSDNYLRYSKPENYKDADGHGRFDLPHVVLFIGYDFGKGWSMGSEVEFEHGGTESAVEIEEEEGGEYESEVERGGEVALEQFWIQKSFCRQANLRLGHIIVPVGATNAHHMPTEFFGVYRPEGENTIMPCTWHETGISLWGQATGWLRYEVLFLPGLDSDRFGRQGWIHDGAGSPYEFKIANSYAGAMRLDFTPRLKGANRLRLSLSGYYGTSFKNTLSVNESERYKDVKGTVAIGAFDGAFSWAHGLCRWSFDYGYLSDSEAITRYNKNVMRKDSPSPRQNIAKNAMAAGVEAGYDVFSHTAKLRARNQKLFVFGRWDYYDSMYRTQGNVIDEQWCGRHCVSAGVNYYPIKDIAIKGEYSVGLLRSAFNNEPAVSIGVTYAGFFTK
ncbi:MAG: hypothetical protein NC388_00805 [Clostridium sp.]|nr:hypothetical protein [Clostridium sp.]